MAIGRSKDNVSYADADKPAGSRSRAERTKSDVTTKDRHYVTALAKGLQILRCFNADRLELGSAEIARLTKMPQSSVWRLCHTLVEEGYLVKTSSGDRLRPGIAILDLGYAALSNQPIGDLAQEDIRLLAHKYECAVALGVPDGTDIVYLMRSQGAGVFYRDLTVGARVPMRSSPMGWAYLAALSIQARNQMLEQLRRSNPHGLPELAAAMPEILATYRKNGYILNKGFFHPQINAVAVPIVGRENLVKYTLVAGGLKDIFTDTRLHDLAIDLKALAGRLTTAVILEN